MISVIAINEFKKFLTKTSAKLTPSVIPIKRYTLSDVFSLARKLKEDAMLRKSKSRY